MTDSPFSFLTWSVRLAAPLLLVGCSHVGSSSAGLNTVSGEAWYVRTTTFLGLPVSNSVWYCAPPSEEDGHPLCREAKIHGADGKKFTPIRPAIERDEPASTDDSLDGGSSKSAPTEDQNDKEDAAESVSSDEADSRGGDEATSEDKDRGEQDETD